MADLLEVRLATGRALAADVLAVGCWEGEAPGVAGLGAAVARAVRAAARQRSWRGEADQLRRTGGAGGVGRVVLLGLGKREEFDGPRSMGFLRRALEEARQNDDAVLALALPEHPSLADPHRALAVLRELALGGYGFRDYKSAGPAGRLRSVRVVAGGAAQPALAAARPWSASVAAAVARARDLANTPPNRATPAWMAEQARELAASRRLAIQVLGPEEMAARGMGGLLGVGSGSANPPRLVRLTYGRRGPAVALVGKGVTFDTGGISIKPSQAMEEMKYDKSGACAVLGTVQAVADLGLPVRLRAYLPFVENMPDGAAYRPSDIVRMANGKTVEVLNTDAEGRLILADALTWAAEERPDALVELSTLTGAAVVALGHRVAALFTPDDALAAELLAAGETSGDRLWRMPLWREYREAMKGEHADLKNTGGRWGGACTAAGFLASFTGDVARWAHLDIAGPAYVGADQPGAKGATGFGVALLADWLLRWTSGA
jgi:leucyl aminopeptidase